MKKYCEALLKYGLDSHFSILVDPRECFLEILNDFEVDYFSGKSNNFHKRNTNLPNYLIHQDSLFQYLLTINDENFDATPQNTLLEFFIPKVQHLKLLNYKVKLNTEQKHEWKTENEE